MRRGCWLEGRAVHFVSVVGFAEIFKSTNQNTLKNGLQLTSIPFLTKWDFFNRSKWSFFFQTEHEFYVYSLFRAIPASWWPPFPFLVTLVWQFVSQSKEVEKATKQNDQALGELTELLQTNSTFLVNLTLASNKNTLEYCSTPLIQYSILISLLNTNF